MNTNLHPRTKTTSDASAASGILIVDKPAGWTSHDVVARVRRLLGTKRVGHTGTLDPFATGVLVILVGRATRLAQFLARADKEYQATIRFGFATDTGDLTGSPRTETGVSNHALTAPTALGTLGTSQIEAALDGLRGASEQVPPMYSAKKIDGRKLYELARRGIKVERAARPIIIHELEAQPRDGALLRFNDDGVTCDLDVRVVCSAGTYIRVLAETIGERLGTSAHLAWLRRTRAGAFLLEHGTSLDALAEAVNETSIAQVLLPLDAALPELPYINLLATEKARVQHGVWLEVDRAVAWADNQQVRMRDEQGDLIGIGVYAAESNRLQPRVLLEH